MLYMLSFYLCESSSFWGIGRVELHLGAPFQSANRMINILNIEKTSNLIFEAHLLKLVYEVLVIVISSV